VKLGIIIGSHRKQSNSAKAAKYLINALPRLVPHSNHWSIDLGQHPLPLWDEGVWAGEERWTKIWGPISRELVTCDGFIVIAPEYSGMVPAALKNFFLFCPRLMYQPMIVNLYPKICKKIINFR